MTPDPKEITPRSKSYRDWLKEQRCAKCGQLQNDYLDIVPAHQSIFGRGMGIKTNDFTTLGLCTRCHAAEGYMGVETFWKGIDKKKKIIEHLIRYIQHLNTTDKK